MNTDVLRLIFFDPGFKKESLSDSPELSATLGEHSSTSTCEMNWLLPVRTGHVCCVSGSWLRGELEVRLGPTARGEGPAGYKGVERAREAAPGDSTTAGDPEPGPGDDCEFKAATLLDIHQNILMHTEIHQNTLSVPCSLILPDVLIPRHERFLQESSMRRMKSYTICVSLQACMFFFFPFSVSLLFISLTWSAGYWKTWHCNIFYFHKCCTFQYPPPTKRMNPTRWVQQLLGSVPFHPLALPLRPPHPFCSFTSRCRVSRFFQR